MPFPTTDVLDGFNRADNYVGAGNSNWITCENAGLWIYSGVAGPFLATQGQGNSWAEAFPVDQEVFFTLQGSIPNPGFFIECCARLNEADNHGSDCYRLLVFTIAGTVNNDVVQLWSRVSGINSQIGATIPLGADLQLGDQFGMSVYGDELKAFHNGTEVGSRTDGSITTGNYIAWVTFANSGAVRFEDVGGGALLSAIALEGSATLSVNASASLSTEIALAGSAILGLDAHGTLDTGTAGFPTTPVLDPFDRADDYVGAGNTNWVVSNNSGLWIYSNLAGPFLSTQIEANSWAEALPDDQEVFVTIDGLPTAGFYVKVYARLQTANDYFSDGYHLLAFAVTGTNNDLMQLWRRLGGISTQIGADIPLGADLEVGKQFGLQCHGSVMTAYYDGSAVGSRQDELIPSGSYIGLATAANSGAVRFNNFGGGALSTIPPIALQGTATLSLSSVADLTTQITLSGSAVLSMTASGSLMDEIALQGTAVLALWAHGTLAGTAQGGQHLLSGRRNALVLVE